jgi:hypothetical protein
LAQSLPKPTSETLRMTRLFKNNNLFFILYMFCRHLQEKRIKVEILCCDFFFYKFSFFLYCCGCSLDLAAKISSGKNSGFLLHSTAHPSRTTLNIGSLATKNLKWKIRFFSHRSVLVFLSGVPVSYASCSSLQYNFSRRLNEVMSRSTWAAP